MMEASGIWSVMASTRPEHAGRRGHLRHPGADRIVADLVADAAEDVLIGAGTVVTLEQAEAEAALDSGARFLVSPTIDRDP